ncbi:MAG: hypothetical protein Q7S33_02015 [Nanoarchaeota archaeon]|nr:hypothetical protein [Nanoarchaeota archaeon]
MVLNKNKTGLVIGIFAAAWHALWSILVLAGVAQSLIDWVLPLHFISVLVSITTFSITSALMLVIAGFVGGYVMGWVFAWLWNWLNKK